MTGPVTGGPATLRDALRRAQERLHLAEVHQAAWGSFDDCADAECVRVRSLLSTAPADEWMALVRNVVTGFNDWAKAAAAAGSGDIPIPDSLWTACVACEDAIRPAVGCLQCGHAPRGWCGCVCCSARLRATPSEPVEAPEEEGPAS